MIFLGIKYEPLLDPPLSLKFVSGAPGTTCHNYLRFPLSRLVSYLFT